MFKSQVEFAPYLYIQAKVCVLPLSPSPSSLCHSMNLHASVYTEMHLRTHMQMHSPGFAPWPLPPHRTTCTHAHPGKTQLIPILAQAVLNLGSIVQFQNDG